MDATLIKANIAFFNGARSETRRLLKEYAERTRTPGDEPDETPLMLWLDAQTRDHREERIEQLQLLLATVGGENRYGRMAQVYLEEEERYAVGKVSDNAQPSLGLWGVPYAKVVLVVLMLGLVGLFAANVLNRAEPTTVTEQGLLNDANVNPTAVANSTDRRIDLNPDNYRAQYTRGVLNVTAIRPASQEVVEVSTGNRVSPVAGARFYALQIMFECRAGICNAPPEATMAVRLNDGVRIEPRPGVGLVGEPVMQPIAQGRATEGWLVFEVPVASTVHALLLTPQVDEGTPQPALISLPSS